MEGEKEKERDGERGRERENEGDNFCGYLKQIVGSRYKAKD